MTGDDLMNRKKKNRSGMGIVFLTVMVMFVVITIKKAGLEQKNNELKNEIAGYENEIADLTEEQKNIEEYREYVKSDEYIEDIARKKLGLVYPDEIIFEAKE